MNHLHQMFVVRADGAKRVEPADGHSVGELLDDLPLGVYEGLRTFHHNRFIGLSQHLERTQLSMQRFGWTERLEREPLCRALHQVATDYEAADARIRFDILSASVPQAGIDSRTVITLTPFEAIAPELLERGVTALLTRALRRATPLVKRADFTLARKPYTIHQPDSFEHIMVDEQDHLLEGTTSNFFYVADGVLKTPGSAVLEGVTRSFVLYLADQLGMAVAEEPVSTDELDAIDEAFITSSVKGIVPLRQIETQVIGSGAPGELTLRLMRAYDEYAETRSTTALETLSRAQQA